MEGELRKQLRDLRLSIRNKRHSLAADESGEAKLLERLDELSQDAEEAFGRTRNIGLPEEAIEDEAPTVEEQRSTEAQWPSGQNPS